MGLGIPVVCSPHVGDTSEIVDETKSGITLESLTPESYRKAVLEMEAFPNKSKAAIREGAYRYFDLKTGIKKYRSIYTKLAV